MKHERETRFAGRLLTIVAVHFRSWLLPPSESRHVARCGAFIAMQSADRRRKWLESLVVSLVTREPPDLLRRYRLCAQYECPHGDDCTTSRVRCVIGVVGIAAFSARYL